MFFTHKKPHIATLEERLGALRAAGFETSAATNGSIRISKGACAAEISNGPAILTAGILEGGEIAAIVDVGYQKQLHTPNGVRLPARAEHLKSLHAFLEDLREGLGLTSLYNESLGSTNRAHLYDRVAGREK